MHKPAWRIAVLALCILVFLLVVTCSKEMSAIYDGTLTRYNASWFTRHFFSVMDVFSDFCASIAKKVITVADLAH